MHSFMQEDLLSYIYGETSIDQSNAIKAALETDWNLKEKYQELTAAKNELTDLKLSPRKEAVDFVLNYANKKVGVLYSAEG
jgi:anti-sigma factor RsiW